MGFWLLRLGIGMLIALLGWMILVAPFLAWVEHRYQDLRYGTPRAAHLSTVVGHNHDSAQHPTYLEVVNDHGTVLLLEIPAGDLSKA
ncbi:MAG: hypothetical protein J2P36_22170, partial [Ktedonobacteraceae bacterium]|nr:hypothetical protein [Ktedonobacteraceae bacterium]